MSESSSSGRWVELSRTWSDANIVSCPVCGKLIPRRSWELFDDDTPIRPDVKVGRIRPLK